MAHGPWEYVHEQLPKGFTHEQKMRHDVLVAWPHPDC